jgi:hypothetical protein
MEYQWLELMDSLEYFDLIPFKIQRLIRCIVLFPAKSVVVSHNARQYEENLGVTVEAIHAAMGTLEMLNFGQIKSNTRNCLLKRFDKFSPSTIAQSSYRKSFLRKLGLNPRRVIERWQIVERTLFMRN